MSFIFADDKGVIKVVVSKDSAIGEIEEKEKVYANYLIDLDELKLELKEAPTRFCLRKTLDYKSQQRLMRAQMRQKGQNLEFDLSSILEQVRLHLVGIENPPQLDLKQHILFKRDDDGYANKEIVAGLQSHGVLMDLFTAIQNCADGPKATSLVKKS